MTGLPGLSPETAKSWPIVSLRIGNLEGQARFAQFLPLFGPGFVRLAFGVVGGCIGAGELDRVHAAEVPYLVALRFQPDILYSVNLCGQGLDPIARLPLIPFRNS